MRKSKFSEHQILAILKAVEAGRPVMKYSGQKTLESFSNYIHPIDEGRKCRHSTTLTGS